MPRETHNRRSGGSGKRRRVEPAAPRRARRPRRAVNYDDSEDLELAPPDDEDGWD